MRHFLDRDGKGWEAVVGRGSWGEYLILFVPREGGGPVLAASLEATSFDEAVLELDRLDDEQLVELLEEASPKRD